LNLCSWLSVDILGNHNHILIFRSNGMEKRQRGWRSEVKKKLKLNIVKFFFKILNF